MAIVKTYHYPGCTVHIDDDCYKDVPPEDMQQRIKQAERVAWEIINKRECRREKSIADSGV